MGTVSSASACEITTYAKEYVTMKNTKEKYKSQLTIDLIIRMCHKMKFSQILVLKIKTNL